MDWSEPATVRSQTGATRSPQARQIAQRSVPHLAGVGELGHLIGLMEGEGLGDTGDGAPHQAKAHRVGALEADSLHRGRRTPAGYRRVVGGEHHVGTTLKKLELGSQGPVMRCR